MIYSIYFLSSQDNLNARWAYVSFAACWKIFNTWLLRGKWAKGPNWLNLDFQVHGVNAFLVANFELPMYHYWMQSWKEVLMMGSNELVCASSSIPLFIVLNWGMFAVEYFCPHWPTWRLSFHSLMLRIGVCLHHES